MGVVIDAQEVFILKRAYDKARKRKLPKGRTRWTHEDELGVQKSHRLLHSEKEALRGRALDDE